MKFLIVGDVVGKSGMEKLKKTLEPIKKEYTIDFCIVNGENAANGKGIRMKEYYEILEAGADVITLGNHIYYRKEMATEYEKLPKLLLPANVTNINGHGSIIVEKQDKKIGIINLIGKVEMGEMFEKNTISPFVSALKEIEDLKSKGAEYIFVDFHAEATAEKIAMGYYLEDKVTCLFGTHTHVQTADERILPNGMAYITDVGMTGPKDSVIGLKKEVALKRFATGAFAKYECSNNEAIFNAVVVECDDISKKAIHIERINQY